jgi:hypothetical protein
MTDTNNRETGARKPSKKPHHSGSNDADSTPNHVEPPPRDVREAPAPNPNGKPDRTVDSDG